MKIGTCHLWGDSLDEFRAELRAANQQGFDYIAIGDSPAGWHDLFMSMAVAVQETDRATIMPFVTSPKIRHPLAAANALSSLYDISGGRIACGLSTGGSNIMAIGETPANQKQIRDYFQAINALLVGDAASYQGRSISSLRFGRKFPLYYSAFGPKALQLAGEMADGIILFSNGNMDGLDAKLKIFRDSATRAGRDADSLEIIVTAYFSVRETKEQAVDDLKAFIVVNGMAMRTPELLAAVPTEYRAAIDELHRRYDPTEHVVAGGKNAQLLSELELTNYLSQFDTIAGTPDYTASVMSDLKKKGVDLFIANLPGHADKLGTIQRLAQVAERI